MIGSPASMWAHIREKLSLSEKWETADRIARRTGIGKSSVALALMHAWSLGLIEVIPRYRATSARYRKLQSAPVAPCHYPNR